jgi:hypothetical protein
VVSKKGVSLCSKSIKHMSTTTTTPETSVIELTTGTMAGDVFYGTFKTMVKGKPTSILVSNHIKENKEYEFRVAAKCQAGFINISDWKTTPGEVISGFKKNHLVNIQAKMTYENGHELWVNVYTTKSGKWHSIDKGFLNVLTVGDMRQSFPDMCDMNLWQLLGAKTWADKAFVQNK